MIGDLQSGDPPAVGPYRLLARLGAGGMGRVFLARSPGGRLDAIKVIRPDLAQEPGFRARFAREIAAAQRVSGVYTAAVVDSDAAAELPWMATAYVRGPSLDDAVRADGPLPLSTVLTLAAGLAEALVGIHRVGVVHRDLKPSNVILAADGPRVIDFGISLAAEKSALSVDGVVVGSPGFMSPEQASAERDVDKQADVFSLGAVLVFAVTGSGPFGDGGPSELLYRVVKREPDLTKVPDRLLPLVEGCLRKDPAARPTPAEILDMLATQDGVPTGEWLPPAVVDTIARLKPLTEVEAATPPGPARSRWRRWRWPGSVAAALVILAIVPTIIFTVSRGTPTAYASASLATGSPQVTARVYFGQLKAVISALAGQVTFNTLAAAIKETPGRCALTVVFAGVTNPTGAVYSGGLDTGWVALEGIPGQVTAKGMLHQQIVTPAEQFPAGKTWQLSATLVDGSQRLLSENYSLEYQGAVEASQTWLIDGHAVSCNG